MIAVVGLPGANGRVILRYFEHKFTHSVRYLQHFLYDGESVEMVVSKYFSWFRAIM